MSKIEVTVQPGLGMRAELAKLRRALQHLPKEAKLEDVIRRLEARVEEQVEIIQAEHQRGEDARAHLGQVHASWNAAEQAAENYRKDTAQARDGWREKFHFMEESRNEARQRTDKVRAKHDRVCEERDGAGEERDMWRGKFHETEAYFQDGIKDDAQRAGIDTRGLVGMAIVHEMADHLQRLKTQRDEWKERAESASVSAVASISWERELEKLEGHIRDEAIRQGIRTEGLTPQQLVNSLVDLSPRPDAKDWEGSFARLKETIHHHAKALAIPTHGTCRSIVECIAHSASTWAETAAVADDNLQRVKAELKEQAGTVKDLQRVATTLEQGIREALARISTSYPSHVESALHKALEQASLDGCEPIENPCDSCSGKQCSSCSLTAKPTELREKLEQVQRLMASSSYGTAKAVLKDALAMADHAYYRNEPLTTDKAYQALETAAEALTVRTMGCLDIQAARDALEQARKLLIRAPKMERRGMRERALREWFAM